MRVLLAALLVLATVGSAYAETQCYSKGNQRICCWSFDGGKNWYCG